MLISVKISLSNNNSREMIMRAKNKLTEYIQIGKNPVDIYYDKRYECICCNFDVADVVLLQSFVLGNIKSFS